MERAFGSFKDFFKEKTMKEWEERATDIQGGGEQAFIYVPPRAGLPQGDYVEKQNASAIAGYVEMLDDQRTQRQQAGLPVSGYVW